jgi:hypothetical protein
MRMHVPLARFWHTYFGLAVELALVSAGCLLAWFFPRIGDSWFRSLEIRFSRLAAKKRSAIWVVFATTAAVRLLLLPLIGVPAPTVHDEYSYLLMADTFVHGRLANPSHPMWLSFETFHVNWVPTYSSMYPPAQGFVLAIGQRLGHPWLGVLLSVSLMSAAVLWMLQAWMPARWAFLGAFFAAFNLGITSYWINSYWGGAVSAIGGALVLGALPRLRRRPRARYSLLLGLGIAILANSRPLEGFIFCLPAGAALLFWLRGRASPPLRVTARRVLVPLVGVLVLLAAFIGYYNWRLTGSAFLFPHTLNERTYDWGVFFLWQPLSPPGHYHNSQFEHFYNGWLRNYHHSSLKDIAHVSGQKARNLLSVFLWSGSLPILFASPLVFGDRKIRLLLIEFAVCVLALFAVVYSAPHYAGPLTCVFYAILVQAARHLRTIRSHGRPVGVALARLAVLSLLLVTAFNVYLVVRDPGDHYAWTWNIGEGSRVRFGIEKQVSAMPGKHLIVVRYSPNHNVDDEWVYNQADIDDSKIVWARELGTEQDRKLLAYFQDRQVWLFEPDRNRQLLEPYVPPPAEESSR